MKNTDNIENKNILSVPCSEVDRIHGCLDGDTAKSLRVILPYLHEGEDYISSVYGRGFQYSLTITGYIFVSRQLFGSTDPLTAVRQVIGEYFTPQPAKTVEKELSPLKIIAEQVRILQDAEDKKIPEKLYRQNLKQIHENVSDPEAEAWMAEMRASIKELSIKENRPFQVLLKDIYCIMRNKYGFVKDAETMQFKNKYNLDSRPSVFRAVADSASWRSIFSSIVQDIKENTGKPELGEKEETE